MASGEAPSWPQIPDLGYKTAIQYSPCFWLLMQLWNWHLINFVSASDWKSRLDTKVDFAFEIELSPTSWKHWYRMEKHEKRKKCMKFHILNEIFHCFFYVFKVFDHRNYHSNCLWMAIFACIISILDCLLKLITPILFIIILSIDKGSIDRPLCISESQVLKIKFI